MDCSSDEATATGIAALDPSGVGGGALRPILCLLGLTFGCAVFLQCLQVTQARYPYYLVWDMDLVTALDQMALAEGELPDHTVHPGTGMLLPQAWLTQGRAWWRSEPPLRLDSARQALNPLLRLAVLTDFLRSLSPYVGLLVLLSLNAVLLFRFRAPWWAVLLGFVLLGSMETFYYQAALIRTEFYAVAWWSLGMALLAASAVRSRCAGAGWVVAGGVCVGLALQAKVQALFLVFLAPVLLLGLMPPAANDDADTGNDERRRRVLMLGVATLGLALLLSVLAWGLPGRAQHWSYPGTRGVTLHGLLVLAVLAACPAGVLLERRLPAAWRDTPRRLVYFAAGAILSFALSLLAYADPRQSVRLMGETWRAVFLYRFETHLTLSRVLWQAWQKWFHHPVLVIAYAAFLLLYLLDARSLSKAARGRRVLLALAATGLMLGGALLTTRAVLHDFLWIDVPLHLLILLFAWQLFERRGWRLTPVSLVSLALLIALGVANLRHVRRMPLRRTAEWNHAGWSDRRFLHYGARAGVLQDHARALSAFYDALPPASLQALRRQAAQHRFWAQTVRTVLPNAVIAADRIGVPLPGCPARIGKRGVRFRSIFPAVADRETAAVDLTGLRIASDVAFEKALVRRRDWSLVKRRPTGGAARLLLFNRPDLTIYLCTTADHLDRLRNGATADLRLAEEDRPAVTIRTGQGEVSLVAARVVNYSELPPIPADAPPTLLLILQTYGEGTAEPGDDLPEPGTAAGPMGRVSARSRRRLTMAGQER